MGLAENRAVSSDPVTATSEPSSSNVVSQGSYITIDRWRDEADFDEFMAATSTEYHKIDKRLAALTTSEELIGQGSIAE